MIKLPSYLTGFSSKTDGSASIRFATQELSDEEFGLLKRNLNEYGWLVFSPTASEVDVPDEIPDKEDFEKTPSKRLYDVLFVYFVEVKKGDKAKFNEYYRKEIDKIIEHIKSKLN